MINLTIVQDNLKVGQVFKSYKELCAVLGEEAKDGSSRQAQIKSFKRFFDFDKIEIGKQAIRIKTIYDNPKPIIDGRSNGGNSIYNTLIENILLKFLLNNNNSFTFFRTDLLLMLGMINNNYVSEGFDEKLIANNIANRKQIEDWKNLYYQVSDKILFRVCDSMKKRGLIFYKKELLYDQKGLSKTATKEDEDKYNSVTDQVLEIISLKYNKKFNSIYQMFPKYADEFYRNVNSIMFKDYNWMNIKTQYMFKVIATNYLDKANLDESLQFKKMLNNEIVDAVNAKIISNYRNLVRKNKEEIENINKHMAIGKAPDWVSKYDYLVNGSDYVNVLQHLTNEYVIIQNG